MAVLDTPSILIVGAGIAGLYTALELYRHGYRNIRIVERARRSTVSGDYFVMNASALATFHHYPDMLAEFNNQASHEITVYNYDGTRMFGPTEAEWNQPGCVHVAKVPFLPMVVHRPSFFDSVLRAVERRMISIEWSSPVFHYGEDVARDVAWVELKDGRKLEADLVIAADGIGTKSHGAVTGREIEAYSSGFAVLRTTVPTEIMLQSQFVRDNLGWNQDDRAEFRTYLAPHQHFVLSMSREITTIFYTHKDNGTAEESWSAPVPTSRFVEALKEVPGWDPVLPELVKQIPEGKGIDWRLMWRDPQPKWTSDSGRILQLGDAAHSFLPTSGNGATQGVEDALSLAACIAKAGPGNVAKATKVHNLLRYERASTLQKKGFTRRQDFHHAFDDAGKFRKDVDLRAVITTGKWLWQHDPSAYATENYEAALAHLESGAPFENTNLPPGYTYEPWTIKEQLAREEQGIMTVMEGDWS